MTGDPAGRPGAACQVARYHSPQPLRLVAHHIQPLEAGGRDVPSNRITVCDNCHVSIGILMWMIANEAMTVRRPNGGQLAVARQGVALCRAAGTTGMIPAIV